MIVCTLYFLKVSVQKNIVGLRFDFGLFLVVSVLSFLEKIQENITHIFILSLFKKICNIINKVIFAAIIYFKILWQHNFFTLN